VDDTCNDDERPGLEIFLDEYWIDRAEVTVEEFARCVEAGACPAPVARTVNRRCNHGDSERGGHPVNCVDWTQANTYCRWAGKRLPTESEWEKAARGEDKRKFPWGNEPVSCALAVWRGEASLDGCGRDSTWPVCSKEAGKSPYGLCDMSGNVWEWVEDWYDAAFYGSGPLSNPLNGTESKARVMRGGGWDCGYDVALRASERGWLDPSIRPFYAGFRCARTLPRPQARTGGPAWARIPATTFQMGSASPKDDAGPVHEIALAEFEMATTEVTVRQYRACVKAGGCTEPHWDDGSCHVPLESQWGAGILPETFRLEDLPVVCVDWEQAMEFARWSGARLCNEAEWECAARSGGKEAPYPWGSLDPTCDRSVMNDGGAGCGKGTPWPPCSREAGNSEQGICDLAGNVCEWVVDWYRPYRPGAPSSSEGPLVGDVKVFRGGSFINGVWRLNAHVRRGAGTIRSAADRGIRLCR